MRDIQTKMFCLLIVIVVFYFIYNQSKTNKKINKEIISAAQLNAQSNPNANAQRYQRNQLDVDRLPLVEENTHIIPANEIMQMNYMDFSYKDQVEKELYTPDAPLFAKGPTNLVPLDVNDSTHRRVNFYA
jgi:hypothetical protein